MAEELSLSLEQLARAADLSLPPWRHAVRRDEAAAQTPLDCTLRIEARDGDGARQPCHDLELEIYRSGEELNLMLSRVADGQAPLLWHGRHPVWLHPDTGERCERPGDGAGLEALCRRLRALLAAERHHGAGGRSSAG
ncbi:MAG: hypothetical protein MUD04_01975 [Cyanobium sp. Prado107]|jgi:hypothetical protein|nr:hypothetical protein [Cyanobium sp. Prado107]